MTVLSTTRNPAKADALHRLGVERVLIDDGDIASQVRRIVPGGGDRALELVGTPTVFDTLRANRVHGVVCFTGMLSNQWIDSAYSVTHRPDTRIAAVIDNALRGMESVANGVDTGSYETPQTVVAVPSADHSPVFNLGHRTADRT